MKIKWYNWIYTIPIFLALMLYWNLFEHKLINYIYLIISFSGIIYSTYNYYISKNKYRIWIQYTIINILSISLIPDIDLNYKLNNYFIFKLFLIIFLIEIAGVMLAIGITKTKQEQKELNKEWKI